MYKEKEIVFAGLIFNAMREALTVKGENIEIRTDRVAKTLIEQGYGNIEQAVREFAEELKEIFDTKHTAVIANVVRSRVDELIKKRYGMEEL